LKNGPNRYDAYINGPEWRARSDSVILKRGRRCEECEVEDVPVVVHHLNYDHLGCERDADLKVLCWACHPDADRNRETSKGIEIENEEKLQRLAEAFQGDLWDRFGLTLRSLADEEIYDFLIQYLAGLGGEETEIFRPQEIAVQMSLAFT